MINVLRWLRDVLGRVFPQESDLNPQNMEDAISLWMQLFCDKPPWLEETHNKTLALASAISAEFAKLIMVESKSEITGSPRADFLNSQYKNLLKILRTQLEIGCASGGIIFKPYVCGGKIIADCISQECFIPCSADNERLNGALFFDRQQRGKYLFTRLEKQEYISGTHTIISKAFVSTSKDSIGKEIPLADTPFWGDIQPEIKIDNVDRPLFGFFKVPLANHIAPRSPLGVSVFSRAVKQLKQADVHWDYYMWEFEGGQMAIDADSTAFKKDDTLPQTKERLFRRSDFFGAQNEAFYKVFAPALRNESYSKGLDDIKREIEFKCNLAYGTLSQTQNVDKTAEEIKSSKQRSYSTVVDMQQALQIALDDYIYAMDALATVCRLAPAGEYEVQYNWGDGITEDAQLEQQIRMQEAQSGITTKEYYLAWRYGVTPEKAKEMIPKQSNTKPFFSEDGEE